MAATRGLGWSLGRALRLPNRITRAYGQVEKLSKPYSTWRNLGRLVKNRPVQTRGMRVATLQRRQARLSAFLARKGATRQLAIRRGFKRGAGVTGIGGAGYGYMRYRKQHPRYQYSTSSQS